MSRSVKLLPLALAISAVTLAPAAQAQQLEEVIVTAQKRAESLQDVPISVSAIGGKQIQDAGIPDLTALADYVPNLHIATASVNTNIYMRGVGSGNNQAFEQSVGMYIDGVYMGRGRQYRAGFLDIERVEVLRGPQGTLFGKNTVAGAVNITTASPDVGGETTGEIMASFEENGGQNYQGFISGSLSDTLAARLAFNYRENDGYLDNAQFDIPEGGKTDEGIRLTLAWEPSDTFSANLKLSHFEGERIGSNSSTQQYLAPSQRDIDVPNRSAFASTAYAITDMFYPEFGEVSAREFTTYKDNNYGVSRADGIGISFKPDSSEDSVSNAALALDWDVAGLTLTSITAYTGYEYEDDVDVDWLPL
jgi:iron complex outermembrane recepter protein